MADSMNEEDEERHSLDYFVWKSRLHKRRQLSCKLITSSRKEQVEWVQDQINSCIGHAGLPFPHRYPDPAAISVTVAWRQLRGELDYRHSRWETEHTALMGLRSHSC
jgi:hypothetical protein